MTRTLLAAFALLALPASAHAIIGGAPAEQALGAHVVSIVSTSGSSCSGVVVGRDLVLTAGHCVDRPGNYAVLLRGGGALSLAEIGGATIHPGWTRAMYAQRKPSPDLALVRTRAPLPASLRPIALSAAEGLPAAGTRYTIAGFGFAEDGNEKSAGVLRSVTLTVELRYVAWQVRLKPVGKGAAGACAYDSGGAVLSNDGATPTLAGIIDLALGSGSRNCGAATIVSMLGPARSWLAEAARKLGSRLGE